MHLTDIQLVYILYIQYKLSLIRYCESSRTISHGDREVISQSSIIRSIIYSMTLWCHTPCNYSIDSVWLVRPSCLVPFHRERRLLYLSLLAGTCCSILFSSHFQMPFLKSLWVTVCLTHVG